VEEPGGKRRWLKRLALVGTLASWPVFLLVLTIYLSGSDLIYSIKDALIVFFFSLALIIGIFVVFEIQKDSSFKEPRNSTGSSSLETLGLIISYVLVFAMGMVYILYIWGVS